MAKAPTAEDIFQRAADEGRHRLDRTTFQLAATGFIAGFTIVFGILAFAATYAASEPVIGPLADVTGALAFAIGIVMLVVQRAELFSENFFDPVATAFRDRPAGIATSILRLWGLTLAFNLIGGGLMAYLTSLAGMVPPDADRALSAIAEEIAKRTPMAVFVSAVVGGALVSLLSYALAGAGGVSGRIAMSFLVAFVLAVGPFDHVVVTALHLYMGQNAGAAIGTGQILQLTAIAAAGNLVGGVGLVAFSHAAQARA